MAETSGIAWTDSTFNPWKICTPISPGCANCYAAAMARRWGWGEYKQGVPRQRTSVKNWEEPLAWNRRAAQSGKRMLVFCASLADVFDNEVPVEWRGDLWRLIHATPNLTWLLLTKRIGNAAKMIAEARPRDDGRGAWPWPNVWLGASVVNQEEADRDIPKLLATPAAKRFVSYEPALGQVDFSQYLRWKPEAYDARPPLNWIIVGGESAQGGAKARPFDLAWARSVVAQCRAAGVPVFVKQLGSHPTEPEDGEPVTQRPMKLKDRAGVDPAEWPEDLRVQDWPA